MAVPMSPKQKVYQGVLQEIRKFIDANGLIPGDKLPSERELSDKLQAGRSSVREALRAMELLGLIETRHGEGTFLSTYRPYQTVELLSSFILQENTTKNDIALAKQIMEKEAAKLAYPSLREIDFDKLRLIIENPDFEPVQKHIAFFNYIFDHVENLLLAKIWMLMEEFSSTFHTLYYENTFYAELIHLYSKKQYDAIETLFDKIIKLK